MKRFGLNYKILVFALMLTAPMLSIAKTSDQNLLTLNKARALYERNKLADALNEYNKISKTSDFWVESVEEKAWGYTRSENYDRALSELKSISNVVFAPFTGPETLMLAAFIDYKICNYKGVFEKIKNFKEQMLPRVEALESIVSNPNSDFVKNWVKKMRTQQLTAADLGPDLTRLPRYFYRDAVLLNSAHINIDRMKILAQNDLEEISKNLKKMKIIEVEVIQRSFDYQKPEDKNLAFDTNKSKDALVFPAPKDSEEVWLDEIGKYEVKTIKCPTNSRKNNS